MSVIFLLPRSVWVLLGWDDSSLSHFNLFLNEMTRRSPVSSRKKILINFLCNTCNFMKNTQAYLLREKSK
jgi:hypothetical protein